LAGASERPHSHSNSGNIRPDQSTYNRARDESSVAGAGYDGLVGAHQRYVPAGGAFAEPEQGDEESYADMYEVRGVAGMGKRPKRTTRETASTAATAAAPGYHHSASQEDSARMYEVPQTTSAGAFVACAGDDAALSASDPAAGYAVPSIMPVMPCYDEPNASNNPGNIPVASPEQSFA